MINIIRIIIKHKDVFTLILASIISITLLFLNDSPPILNIKSKLTNTYTVFIGPVLWYKNSFNLKEKNSYLEKKITELNLENIKLSSYLEENNRLKKMLKYRSESSFNLKVANVINHNLSPNINSFSIDIGLSDEIKNNLPVIDTYGILGKIYSVEQNQSIIQLITDKNFRISVRVGKNRTLGIFVPSYSKFGLIEGVPKSQKIVIGETILTSGISDIYPSNIPIAKVISTYINPNQLFQNITVEILADIFNPDYVFIVE